LTNAFGFCESLPFLIASPEPLDPPPEDPRCLRYLFFCGFWFLALLIFACGLSLLGVTKLFEEGAGSAESIDPLDSLFDPRLLDPFF